MTKCQKKVYDAIVEHMLEKGYPPSVRELCEMTGLKSTGSVHSHISHLEQNGYIKTANGAPRTITVPGIVYADVRRQMGIGA